MYGPWSIALQLFAFQAKDKLAVAQQADTLQNRNCLDYSKPLM
jgi:hypothetical protein